MTTMTPTGIAYDDRGAGKPALLFLPGWCGPRTLFDPLIDRLDPSRRTLAIDWRGHGESKPVEQDFGTADLVADAVAVLDASGTDVVVPVAVAHAGWVAIELRRHLGPERVPRLVFIDWMVLGAPEPFRGALAAMAARPTTREVVDQVTAMWVAGLDHADLSAYVASMAAVPDEMWARGAREIGAAFDEYGSPLDAVATLEPIPPTLHLYAQPADPAYLEAQRRYAEDHSWFEVHHLEAASHFPMFEVADTIADHIGRFTA